MFGDGLERVVQGGLPSDLLENSPEQSLFVIEEPETSLHENAQFELGKYLLDVCNRRHHQIVLTTHSSTLLHALPADARVMLLRDAIGVAAFPQMSAARARSVLSGGHHRALCVLVEDDFAKLLLTEMVRAVDPTFLRCIEIHGVGDTKAVRSGALFMQRIGRAYAAIRDPDIGPEPAIGLYAFPGARPPEREVYEAPAVRHALRDSFGLDVPNVLAQRGVTDHHEFTKVLSEEASAMPGYLATFAVRAYLNGIGAAAYQPLVKAIQARLPQ